MTEKLNSRPQVAVFNDNAKHLSLAALVVFQTTELADLARDRRLAGQLASDPNDEAI